MRTSAKNIALKQMPRYAQELYIQGLSEGMLKHWGKGRDGFLSETGHSDSVDDEKRSVSLDDASELLYWWQDVVNSELIPAGQRALESGSTSEMKEVLNKLNFESFKLGEIGYHENNKTAMQHSGGVYYKEM